MNRYHQFLNQNEYRKYPFSLNCENHWIHQLVLDIKLIVYGVNGSIVSNGNCSDIYIKKIYRTGNQISILISNISTGIDLAIGTLRELVDKEKLKEDAELNNDIEQMNRYASLNLSPCGSIFCTGSVIISVERITEVPIGINYIDHLNSAIDPRVIIFIPIDNIGLKGYMRYIFVNEKNDKIVNLDGLTDEQKENNLNRFFSQPVDHILDSRLALSGIVKFIEGNGIKIIGDKYTNTIQFELKNKEDFYPECDTCDPQKCSGGAIYQLNNVLPDVNGKITLEGDGLTFINSSIDPENPVITVDSPDVTVNDLCTNKEETDGPPGPQGPQGPPGLPGKVICGEADCNCSLCDTESIDDCDNIIDQT